MDATSFYFLPPRGIVAAADRTAEVLNLALALNAGRTANELVDFLFDGLDGLLPFDRIGVALLEPEDVLRSHYVRSALPIKWGIGAYARLADTSLGPIVRERKIRVIEDLATYVAEHPRSKTAPLLLAEGMRSSLTVPLATAEGPLGVMFFSCRCPRAYGAQHVDFVSTIAEAIAAALARARLADRLRWANDELRTLDQLKANFLAALSHELRTPLTLITANAEALADEAGPALGAAHRRYVDEICAGADRLGRMLDTLFDYAALEAGRLLVEKVPLDAGGLLRGLGAELGPSLAEAGLAFEVDVPGQPLIIEADPQRLAQAIRALADNARKFTPAPGSVALRARLDGRRARIEVQDSGIGIADLHQARIFDPFFQVESGATRTYGGAGLGLALARAIVLAHGGALMVSSEAGRGSTFTIVLPAT